MTENQGNMDIQAGLRRIRNLRRCFLALLIAFVPAVLFLSTLPLSPKVFMGSGIGIICLGIVLEVLIAVSRCPACREFYHVRGMSGSFFTGKCVHCGVPLKS